MEGFELEVKSRESSGTSACRRYRREGLVPSIVYYSRSEKGIPVLVSAREFSKLGKTAKTSTIFTLKGTVADLNDRMAVVKEIQLNHLSGEVLHVDFQALHENEEVTVPVGIKVVGESRGVKLDGGILTIVTHAVRVRCLPRLMPREFQVDVTDLGIGDSLKVKDIKVQEGVKILDSQDEPVASVTTFHVVEEAAAAPAEGAAAPAAGAAAAPAAGAAAAPAAGAAAGAAAPAKGAAPAKAEAKK